MDLAFVRGLGLGIAGAAVATVIAQGLSAVISFCLLLRALKGYAETRTVSGAADFAEQKNSGGKSLLRSGKRRCA